MSKEGNEIDMKKLINVLFVVTGTFILAISVEFFILPYHILSGGVAGVAVAFEPFFHLDETLVANTLTLALLIVGTLILGKQFGIDTILSSFCYPVFTTALSYVAPMIPIHIEPFLASLYAGLLGGVGIGLVMRAGASTGGMDVPPLIAHKLFGVKVATGVMVTDGITVLLGVLAYGIDAALIGLISVFASGIAIDKILPFGAGSNAKSVTIISEKWKEIADVIMRDMDRGVTFLAGEGGYQMDKKKVILCVVSAKQYSQLVEIINQIDDRAFTITTDASDMHGEGFTYPSATI